MNILELRTRRLNSALLAIATVLLVLGGSAQAQNTVGSISQVTGTANVQRAGATIAAVPRMPVALHDRIVTQPGASLTILMIDNSTLRLGESSTLTIDESMMINGVGAPSKVGLLGGSLHSLITGAMRGTSTTFEVHTPNAVGAVRGTEWDTSFQDGASRPDFPGCTQFTDVAVQDGIVNVSNSAGAVDVHAGHKTTVPCFAAPAGGAGAAAAGAAGGLGVAAAAGIAAAGVAAVGGATVGILEGTGTIGSNGNGNGKPKKPKTPKD
jgi:hypothetical protein